MQKRQNRKSTEPLTAGRRELRRKARPPARFSSLRSAGTVNQKQGPPGNTLLAQRYLLSGNSFFWRKGREGASRGRVAQIEPECGQPSVQEPQAWRTGLRPL